MCSLCVCCGCGSVVWVGTQYGLCFSRWVCGCVGVRVSVCPGGGSEWVAVRWAVSRHPQQGALKGARRSVCDTRRFIITHQCYGCMAAECRRSWSVGQPHQPRGCCRHPPSSSFPPLPSSPPPADSQLSTGERSQGGRGRQHDVAGQGETIESRVFAQFLRVRMPNLKQASCP